MSKEKILVSACLLGEPVRYDGKAMPNEAVIALGERFELIAVCPECLGGLPTPRTPSEIDESSGCLRVVARDGQDRTDAFLAGAEACVSIAREKGCKLAILKSNSPSCGSGQIYDGTFSGGLIAGNGVTTRLLTSAGVCVISENDVESGFPAVKFDDLRRL
ncbi:MAG: DUF523 domain-containing protein [Coriobacteriia bacterium]|nr:DUF523 domain-containing protein [Coriobacteriia bacterium]